MTDVPNKKNMLEWAVFCVSLLLVIGMLAFWTVRAISHSPSTAQLHVETKPDPSDANPFRYAVTVLNKGGETAENVKINVSLTRHGQELEKVSLEIAFLPKKSKREGYVNFQTRPMASDTVAAHVTSYKKP